MLSKSTICYFVGPDNEDINVPVRTLNEEKDRKKSTKRRDKKLSEEGEGRRGEGK